MAQERLVRQNFLGMSETQKQNFIKAILELQKDGTYTELALTHVRLINNVMSLQSGQQMVSPGMYPYQCPAFLPWYRELCKRFEYNLQLKDSSVSLPYWDWTYDATLNNPADSPMWTDDFMGGNGDPQDGNIVKDGPFAYDPSNPNTWHLVDINGKRAGPLKRAFGIALSQIGRPPALPRRADVDVALGIAAYDYPNWDRNSYPSFRNWLEGWLDGPKLHNQVHLFVGGTMATIYSAFDPVFFLHHCNIDRIWAQWQDKYPNAYPPSGAIVDFQGNRIPFQDIYDLTYPWKEATIGFNIDYRNRLCYTYDMF